MSKQIYIDSNGNEVQVSGTVNTADMMPMSGNDSTKVSEAIGDLSTLTTSDKSSLVGAVNEVVSTKADKASLASILAPTNRLTSSHNMNSVDVGTYYQADASMPTNAPSGANNAYIMVLSARGTDRIQIWATINQQKIYYRICTGFGSSPTWTNWVAITAS